MWRAKNAVKLKWRISRQVQVPFARLARMSQIFEEAFVLLVGERAFGFDPDWRLIIDVFVSQIDGVRYKRGVLSEYVLESCVFREFIHTILQVQPNYRSLLD